MREESRTKIGCCGWLEAQTAYFRDFGVIEVQETFYQPAGIGTYEKWRAAAPRNFEFTIKAWQLITHEPSSPTYRKLLTKIPDAKTDRCGSFRPTAEVFAAWDVTDMVAQALGSKVVLFQRPSSFAPSPVNRRNLVKFFTMIGRRDLTLCWEPRGGWQGKDAKRICNDLDLVHCVDPFTAKPLHGRLRYFRLHRRPGYNLRYRYTEEDLRELSDMIDRKTVYVLFNNVTMLHDTKRFRRETARP